MSFFSKIFSIRFDEVTRRTIITLLGFKIRCSYCDDDRVYEITDMDYYDFLENYIKEHPECVITTELDEEDL